MHDWHAHLHLGFQRREPGTTILAERRHSGPLQVQKALYPEGPSTCHVSVLHPPSGIAGGDRLNIHVNVDGDAHALVNTPGATRWYKANGRTASQTVAISVRANGRLDWLPQENILFEDTDAISSTRVDLETGARAIGWEITQLGSVCADGHWRCGRLRFDLNLNLDGLPLWIDVGELCANDTLRSSDNGMARFPVTATLWAFGPQLPEAAWEDMAMALPWADGLRAGLTHIPKADGQALTLIRVLGEHAQDVRELLIEQWMRLRPLLMDVPAAPVRLWAT